MVNVTSRAAIKEMKASHDRAVKVLGFKKIRDDVRQLWNPIPAIMRDAIKRAEEKNDLREAIKNGE